MQDRLIRSFVSGAEQVRVAWLTCVRGRTYDRSTPILFALLAAIAQNHQPGVPRESPLPETAIPGIPAARAINCTVVERVHPHSP